MKKISLEHLQSLAYGAYASLVMYPEKKAASIINEYTKELNTDIQTIKNSASSAINSSNLQSAIVRYHQRYEFHLTSWLQSSVEHTPAFISPPSNLSVSEISNSRKFVRNKYTYFQDRRKRALSVISKSIKQTQLQQQSNERKRSQLTMNPNNQAQRRKRTWRK